MARCKQCLAETVDWRTGENNTPFLCDIRRVRTLTDAGTVVNGYNLHECHAKRETECQKQPGSDQMKLETESKTAEIPPPMPVVKEKIPGFYRWCAEEYQQHNTKYGQFAREIIKDPSFPKKTKDYIRLRNYIDPKYSAAMVCIFEELHKLYRETLKADTARRMGLI